VKEGGIAAVADTVIAGWLTADFREREPVVTANMKAMMLAHPRRGYLALLQGAVDARPACAAAADQEPTLVIAGRHDMSTTVAAGELIRSKHPRRQHDDHGCRTYFNVEQPHAFTDRWSAS